MDCTACQKAILFLYRFVCCRADFVSTKSPIEEYVRRSLFFSPLIKSFFSAIRWEHEKWVY